MMRAFSHLAAALCVLGVSTPAAAQELEVAIDCYLDSNALECGELISSYFAAVPYATAGSGPGALALELRAIAHASTTRYVVRGRRDRRSVELEADVRRSAEEAIALAKVVALLQQATIVFFTLDAPAALDGDALVLRLGEAGETEDEPEHWYLRPSVSGEMISTGFTVASGRVETEINYSHDLHRLRAEGRLEYYYFDLTLPDVGRLEGGFLNGRAEAVAARSLGHGFVVGVASDVERAPQNNLDVRVRGGGGVEWLSDERLEVDDEIFGVRVGAYATYDVYAAQNLENRRERFYPDGEAAIFARWHGEVVDIAGEASATAPLDRPESFRLRARLDLTLRPTDGLELSLSGRVRFQGDVVNVPQDPNALDPIATLVYGTDFDELAVEGTLSVSYSFGNALLHAQDQRFR
jgi:hypothetical protein